MVRIIVLIYKREIKNKITITNNTFKTISSILSVWPLIGYIW